MNQYVERKINDKKFVSDIDINYITFDVANQRYLATRKFNPITRSISCSSLEISTFADRKITCPEGLCVQPGTDNVLICDSIGNCVRIFNAQKKLLSSVNMCDTEVKCSLPHAVDCDVDGSFVVTDYSRQRVKLFTADGRPVRVVQQNGHLSSICHLNRRFSPSASATFMTACHLSERKISVLNNDGQPMSSFPLADYSDSICADLNGNVCVSTYDLKTHSSLCILDPRMNFKMLQTITIDEMSDRAGGLCVNDLNEIVWHDMNSHALRFLE